MKRIINNNKYLFVICYFLLVTPFIILLNKIKLKSYQEGRKEGKKRGISVSE